MRFEFYSDALADVPKLSVDGTVSNSIHLSHWKGNETAAELKADTSTEIALNLVTSPKRSEFTKGIDLVTNNHFDTDGMLSVWTVMMGERAAQYREVLIAAAEAGDFSEYSTADGVRVSLAIQGSDVAIPTDDLGSPLARMLAGEEVNDDARCYELIMPEVEQLLSNINAYEPLWRDGWQKIRSVENDRGDAPAPTSQLGEDVDRRQRVQRRERDHRRASRQQPRRQQVQRPVGAADPRTDAH